MEGKRSLEINKNMGDFENNVDDEMDLRRGPWTVEEDFKLSNYISTLGEGRWNSLARCAGLKRTGKSCRLRWLNYLRPDVRRGNITLEEQLLILELHSRWGNRWSKIAQYLPGRTDNEIKNYWRTRVQKHAKQLRCDVNSQQFKDTMRYLWMPRLVERIQAASASSTTGSAAKSCVTTTTDQFLITSYDGGANNNNTNIDHLGLTSNPNGYVTSGTSSVTVSPASGLTEYNIGSEVGQIETSFDPVQSLVGPQIMLPSQNYLDDKSGFLNGGLGAMQEQSYPNLFENIIGMIPSYSFHLFLFLCGLRFEMGLLFMLGMKNYRIFVVLTLLIILNGQSSLEARAGADRKVHIVYLGEKQHDDPEFVTESHHQMLWSLLGSKEDAHDSMVYSYRHGFSGFAAKLTKSQAKQIADLPEVVHVTPDSFYELTTTRTWDYLGLSAATPKNLLNDSNMGEEVIIGVVDTGVWPESEVFNDNGIGPVPKHWKGGCESGEDFNSSHCNKKLIGAKYFINGFLADNESFNETESLDFISPRDYDGHGTHVATIAGGSVLPGISYKGLAGGTVRGGAPRARIAMYKACWDDSGCYSADILKAMDEAIHDGVDVLSLSLGYRVPYFPETDVRDAIATGAFHAVLKGITVVCSGGNSGPAAQTVGNAAPWILTVAATTLDRSFPTPLTLGNNKVILGQAMYTGPELGFTGLVYPENPGNSNESFSGTCEFLDINSNSTMRGKVVLCFTTAKRSGAVSSAARYVKNAGGVGVIIARNPGDTLSPCLDDFPCVAVDYELGTNILLYIRSSGSPVVKIQPSKTLIGQPVGTKVAEFSSRGPNSIAPAILKPDIAAPGVSILAATNTNTTFNDRGFIMLSGTSMAAPAISGVVALLKATHRDWSPAAIRSAIVTTAWRTDPSGERIFAEGSPRKLADPFDYGGGLVNPEKAAKPGLVYDLGIEDYVLYMCTVGYNESSISQLVGKGTVCSNPIPSVLDFNLPSITIPKLKEEVTLTRTLTNVGPVDSVYKVAVEPPLGVQVTVTPETLVFNSTNKKVSFHVRVSTTHKTNTGYYFGSLTWSDYVHNVTIPLSVRTQILQNYYDEN